MWEAAKRWATRLYDGVVSYALKFGVVGIFGYVIDVGVFNALRVGVVGCETWLSGPISAKVISVSVATVATWGGNRYWTFRAHRRSRVWQELGEFTLVALGGMAIAVLCLVVSHYVLGFTSVLADNVSTNVVGLVLATSFRFLMYRYWVFAPHREGGRRLPGVPLASEESSEPA